MALALPTIPVGDLVGSVVNSVSNVNLGDIAGQLALGAIVSTATAGLKSPDGQNALDPLHFFHKDGSQTVVGQTISIASFNALSPDAQKQVLAAGFHIVN